MLFMVTISLTGRQIAESRLKEIEAYVPVIKVKGQRSKI